MTFEARSLCYGISPSGGSPLSCYEDSQVTLWTGPFREEIRGHANNQCQLSIRVTEPTWKWIVPTHYALR